MIMLKSLPPREAWIEIVSLALETLGTMSLPPREAWIEMLKNQISLKENKVASPAGSVD